MPYQFQIQIDPEQVTVRVPAKNYVWVGPNMAAYYMPGQRLIALFESSAEVTDAFKARATPDLQLCVEPAFAAGNNHLGLKELAWEYLEFKTLRDLRLHDGGRWWWVGIDYEIQLTPPLAYPAVLLQHWAYALQVHLHVNQVCINGQAYTLPRWQRWVEFGLRTLLRFSPLLTFLAALGFLRTLPDAGIFPGFLASFAAVILLGLLASPLWAGLLRQWLPRSYLRFVLATINQPSLFAVLTKSLTERLLQDE